MTVIDHKPQRVPVWSGHTIYAESHPEWAPPGVVIVGFDGDYAARDVADLTRALEAAAVQSMLATRAADPQSAEALLLAVVDALDEVGAPQDSDYSDGFTVSGRVRALAFKLTTEANRLRSQVVELGGDPVA